MEITLRDLINAGIQLYTFGVYVYHEGAYDATRLYFGDIYDIPEELLDREIRHIYVKSETNEHTEPHVCYEIADED